MNDDVQVVYSAEVEGLIAGNDAAAESVQATSTGMVEAVEAMAAATSTAGEAVQESFAFMSESMAGFSDASAAVVEAGEAFEASAQSMLESWAALGVTFEETSSATAAVSESFALSSTQQANATIITDALTAAYLRLQEAELEQVAAVASVKEAYASLDASVAATEVEFNAITAAEERETSATEQLSLAQRQLAEVQEFMAEESAVGREAINAQTEATERLTEANHSAVTGQQATSAAIRAMEGNAGLRAVENFIAKTLGLGPAMQAIFPVVGALAFADILVEMGKKFYEAFDMGGTRAREAAKDIRLVTEELDMSSTSLDVQIDKLEQEKAKLEKVPFNGTKLVLDEAREAADRLQKSLEGVIDRELDAVKAMSASAMQRMFTGGSKTDYEQTMLQEHTKWLGLQTDAQGKLNESKSYGASLQTRLNELEGKAKTNREMMESAAANGTPSGIPLTSYDEEIKAIQTMLGWQKAEQSQIEKTQTKTTLQGQVQTLKDDKPIKPKTDKSGEAVQRYQEELNQRKIADGEYHAQSTADEIAFWAAKLKLWNDGTNAYREITAKLAELYKQQSSEQMRAAEADYRAYIANDELKLKSVQKGSQQAIAIRNDEELMAIAFYGADSAKALEAAAKRVEAERDAAVKITDERARAAMDSAQAEMKAAEDSGNNQLTVIRAYTEMGLVTKRQAQQEEQAIIAQTDAARVASAEKEVEALEILTLENAKYEKDLEAGYKRLAQAQAQQSKSALTADLQNMAQRTQIYTSFFNRINQDFKTSIDGWLKDTESFGRAFEKTFQGMARSVVENLAEMGMKWAEHEALKLLLTIAGQQAQTLATATGAAERKAINATTALQEANTNAMKAATGAYAATVDIPIVGPVLAPIAAAGAYVAVMGLTALASASGGWGDIPQDQLAMVHKNEMILPAHIAQNVRDMSGGGGGGDTHLHLGGNSYSALGTGAMRNLLQGSQRALVSTMKSAIRDGKMANA